MAIPRRTLYKVTSVDIWKHEVLHENKIANNFQNYK